MIMKQPKLYSLFLALGFIILLISCADKPILTFHENGTVDLEYYINKDSLRHGQLKRYLPNSTLAEESHYTNGKQDGIRILYYENGNPESKATYVNGKLSGTKQVFYDTGELLIDSKYENSEIIGVFKKYYKNGKLQEEVTFANNTENGPFIEYYENGRKKWQGNYLNGDNEFGIIEHFDEDGELIKKLECDSMKICKTIWEAPLESGE